MHIGQQLICPAGSVIEVYSEWMRRGGDNGTFTANLIAVFNAELTVTVFHKNFEETGPGTSAGTVASAVSTVGMASTTIGSLKEMVRYKVRISTETSGELGGLVYRMLAPTWSDTARV